MILYACIVGHSVIGASLVVQLLDSVRLTLLHRCTVFSSKLFLCLAVLSYSLLITSTSVLLLALDGVDASEVYFIHILFVCFGSAVVSFVILFVATADRIFTKDRNQLFLMLSNDLRGASFATVRSISRVTRHALVKHSGLLVLAAILSGGLITTTNAIFLFLLHPHIEIHIYGLVGAYVVSAMMSFVSWLLMCRVVPLYPQYEYWRLLATLILAGSIWTSYVFIRLAIHVAAHETSNLQFVLVVTCVSLSASCVLHWFIAVDSRHRIQHLIRNASPDIQERSVIKEVSLNLRRSAGGGREVKVRPTSFPRIYPSHPSEQTQEEPSAALMRIPTSSNDAEDGNQV